MAKFYDIPGFPGYKINKNCEVLGKQGTVLKRRPHPDGYVQYALYQDGKPTTQSEHRLMALTFIPNPENKETVNHDNGIKTDNRIENLEWMTRSEQSLHARKTGLYKKTRVGTQLECIIIETGEVLEFSNAAECARHIGKNNANILKAIKAKGIYRDAEGKYEVKKIG